MSLTHFCGCYVCLCITLIWSTLEIFILILYFSNHIYYLPLLTSLDYCTTCLGRELGKPETFLNFRMNTMGWSLKRWPWLLHWSPCIVWLTSKKSPPKSHMLESRWPTAGSGWLKQLLGQAGIPVLVLQTLPHTHCCIPSGWCIQQVPAMVPWAKLLPLNYPMDQEKEIS